MGLETKKIAFLGLDGTPYTLVNELIAKGVMPNMKSIADKGALLQMDTTLPEVSSVAWTTFMTGVNPAVHGIYGFMDLKPGTYDMYFTNSKHIKARTLWDRLGETGRRSVVINVPSTYPAKPLNGMLTAGFVALDLKKATYPDSAFEYLNGMGYRIDVDTRKARESIDLLVEDLTVTLAKREEAILHYLERGDWDLFIGVVTETDRLHHFLWDAYADPSHRLHSFFLEYYGRIDDLIGRFAKVMAEKHPGVPYMLMSDHGFTLCEREVYVNCWLRQNGYQSLRAVPPKSWDDIGDDTRAFALDPSRIFINLKGRYPRGTVAPGAEYGALCDELAAKFMAIEFEGRKVLKAAYRKKDIYAGPNADAGADLVLLSNYGFDIKGSLMKEALFEKGVLTGMHTQDDAVLVLGPGLADGASNGPKPNILDVPATIARALGIPVDGLEGRPLV